MNLAVKPRTLLISCALTLLSLSVWASEPPPYAAPPDRRGEEQTFLTFPEWFLVFSPAEYADYVRTHTPDGFCFWGHIGQLWGAYAGVIRETTARHEPTNWGYHLMIIVISVSTTVEYAVRSAYETTIGRTFALFGGGETSEDAYGARVAQQYVDFIRLRPWYEFDFWGRLRGLWSDTPLWGPHVLRKWERKYALTTEYMVKALYGWLITKATGSIYETPLETTTVVARDWSRCDAHAVGFRVLQPISDSEALLALPRYAPFTDAARALARCGAEFEEIAGNRTVILTSVLGELGRTPPAGVAVMTRQAIITQPDLERLVLIVPLDRLGGLLRNLESERLTLEHVFDY
jgi:hypothetical protein